MALSAPQPSSRGWASPLAMVSRGYSRPRAFVVALLTGVADPTGSLIGAAAVSVSGALLPWGLIFGLILMMLLDVTLG